MINNVIVKDPKKVKEIKNALKSSERSFADVPSADKDKLPQNAKDLWYKNANKTHFGGI